MNKPYAPACDRNSQPIFQQLKTLFADTAHVLEIGSGTGQHAVFFASRMPHLQWQPTDCEENLPGISQWQQESSLDNLLPPLALDVCQPGWPLNHTVPAIFTANTLHIMSWQSVEQFFAGVKQHLSSNGKLVVYGPFNYNGSYTSDSNANFDQWLKQRDPASAIRDFEAVSRLAEQAGLQLLEDVAMPANNRLISWVRN